MPRGLVAIARSGGHCPLRGSGGILCSERGQSHDAFQAIPLEETSPRCNKDIYMIFFSYRDSQLVENGVSSPSPIDDILNHSTSSDMPGWKQANQELAGILKNLRKLDHHFQGTDLELKYRRNKWSTVKEHFDKNTNWICSSLLS